MDNLSEENQLHTTEVTSAESVLTQASAQTQASTQTQASEEIKPSEPKPDENLPKPTTIEMIYDIASILMSAFVLLTLVFTFVFRVVGVLGESMQDTVFEGDWLLTTQKSKYVCGDIIVSTQPNVFNEPLIKRVIAAGGQTIDVDYATSTVYVDGKALSEPYRKEQMMYAGYSDVVFPLTVPEGYLFVMGDNRNNSSDSRSNLVGLIDERYILGRAQVRVLHTGDHFKIGDFNIYDYE